ncbi:MAG: hypothetical protein EDM82_13365 [Cyanobacteria bacterium CYA]|nr:MAG: hypothetical protein EDM82_13365 [Cyanobacteria bacterium CYA]
MSVAIEQQRQIAPYRVVDSGRSLRDVVAQVNLSCFECYGPDLRAGPHPDQGRVTVDTLAQYEKLIRELAAIPGLVFVPHTELNEYGCPPGQVVCSIRHDVDADMRAAVAEAEIEKMYGARTSYYILHTAPYYGTWIDGVHHRNGCMAHLYRQIQDLGHEIALHTDPLHLYQNMKLDGAQAVREEIAWLRAQGLKITGTVAHNSAPIYGIENFAIFKGKNRRGLALGSRGEPGEDLLDEIVHQGKWAPLGVLDEAELGLTYEGNDFFRRKDVRIEYGATRFLNRWRWDHHLKEWRKAKDAGDDRFIDQERMLDQIRSFEVGYWLILNVHPLYYGSRHARTSAPAVRTRRQSVVANADLGWDTYEPHTVQADFGEVDGKVEYQSLNYADERGMLDVSLPASTAADEKRVLVLGGRNLDGYEVGIPEHCHTQAGGRLSEALGVKVRVRKLAFPGMGLCRHYGWFAHACERERYDVVVIGVGADEVLNSRPDLWAVRSGWSLSHPGGEYLWVGEDGAVRVVGRSKGAAIRRGRPQMPELRPSLTDPASLRGSGGRDIEKIGSCLVHYAGAARAAGARVLCMLCECGESVGYWRGTGTDDAAAHEHTLRVLGAWAQAAGAEIVDPYERFLVHRGAPTHWRASGTWSHTGHRLAGRALYDALRPLIAGACNEGQSP